MNKFDEALSQTPQSTDDWHCPWFKVIEGLAANGVVFGAIAYVAQNADLGLVAVGVGLCSGFYCFGSRKREGASC